MDDQASQINVDCAKGSMDQTYWLGSRSCYINRSGLINLLGKQCQSDRLTWARQIKLSKKSEQAGQMTFGAKVGFSPCLNSESIR